LIIVISFQNMSQLVLEARCEVGPPSHLWVPEHDFDHESWVKNLTIGLLNTVSDVADLVCSSLIVVCKIHCNFAHKILPLVRQKVF